VKKLAVFGSGAGSNAENICVYFSNSSVIRVVMMCTNKKDALIVERAKKLNIPMVFTSKNELEKFDDLAKILTKHEVDYIILAGFLLRIPSKMVERYPNKIINIHPALLPKYGGKGYYGDYVHKSVLDSKESKSGITIHLVNEKYDDGKVLFQKEVLIDQLETIDSLASKIHKLEHKYYPEIIEKYILNQL